MAVLIFQKINFEKRGFLAVPWVCLLFVIVVFPDHTHYLSSNCQALILSLKSPFENQCVVASKSCDITSREMVGTIC